MTYPTARPAMSGNTPTLVALDPAPVLDLWGMLRVVWLGKWIVLITTLLCILAAGYYAFRITQPRFAATATLEVDAQPTTLRDVSGLLQTSGSDAASLNTQLAILTSNHLLGQVVTEMALLDDPEFNRYLTPTRTLSVNGLRGALRNLLAGTTDTPPSDTAVFEKTIQNLRASLTVHRPRDTYLIEITARSRAPHKAARIANALAAVYVNDQIRAQDASAQEAESWLAGRVVALQSQLEQHERAITSLIANAQVQHDSELDTLSSQVLDIEQELAAALTVLADTENMPRNGRQHTAALQQRTRISAIASRRDSLLSQLSTQSAGLVELHQMQRQADATRVLYETFLARLQETRIQRGLETPNTHIIAAATPGQYIGPRKVLILIISAVIGMILGLALLTVIHLRRKGVVDSVTLQSETGMPVFAEIALCKAHRPRARQKLIKAKHPIFGKAMQDMRTALQISARGPAPKTVLLTSSLPGEGSSSYATALAQSFAHSGKSVLLLTAHARQPTASAWPGLSDVLLAGVSLGDVIRHDPALEVDMVHTHGQDTSGTALLADGFSSLLAKIAERYDHVIIDAPPVLSSHETQLLAQSADMVILAVRWSKTPLDAVKLGLQRLDEADAPASGLILSMINARKARQSQVSKRFTPTDLVYPA